MIKSDSLWSTHGGGHESTGQLVPRAEEEWDAARRVYINCHSRALERARRAPFRGERASVKCGACRSRRLIFRISPRPLRFLLPFPPARAIFPFYADRHPLHSSQTSLHSRRSQNSFSLLPRHSVLALRLIISPNILSLVKKWRWNVYLFKRGNFKMFEPRIRF